MIWGVRKSKQEQGCVNSKTHIVEFLVGSLCTGRAKGISSVIPCGKNESAYSIL
jgi:hypothetical protein